MEYHYYSKIKINKEGGCNSISPRISKLCETAVPTYYLKGKEAEKLDRLAEEGMREYEIGETINATSLKKLLNYMERRIKEVEYSKIFLNH